MGEGKLSGPPGGSNVNEKTTDWDSWLRAPHHPTGPRDGIWYGNLEHFGWTPLHFAAYNGHSELVPVLLAAGPGGPRPFHHPPPSSTLSVTRLCGGLFAFVPH